MGNEGGTARVALTSPGIHFPPSLKCSGDKSESLAPVGGAADAWRTVPRAGATEAMRRSATLLLLKMFIAKSTKKHDLQKNL